MLVVAGLKLVTHLGARLRPKVIGGKISLAGISCIRLAGLDAGIDQEGQ
jgi:hypothetical protein